MSTGSEQFIASFSDLPAAPPGSPSWVTAKRDAAHRALLSLGLPNRKNEEWRYTNVSALNRVTWQAAKRPNGSASSLISAAMPHLIDDAYPIFCIDGFFVPAGSQRDALPEGLSIKNFADVADAERELLSTHFAAHANYRDHTFRALNTAFSPDGIFIHAQPGTRIDKPIQLVCLSSGAAGSINLPRILILAEERSQFSIVECYVGCLGDEYLTSPVTEVIVGAEAHVTHLKVQTENENAYHFSTLQVVQSEKSHFISHAFNFGGKLVRNDINAKLAGEAIECTLNGLYIAGSGQHIDNHTSIEHAQPHCNSHELYKGILTDNAQGVFNGKVFVRQEAQKTDAKQSNMNLLLSDDAVINTKPQLEIFADDVRCTHGATIGQIDEEAIFYLRSRGIDEDDARRIMLFAFASELIEQVEVASVRERLAALIEKKLPIAAAKG